MAANAVHKLTQDPMGIIESDTAIESSMYCGPCESRHLTNKAVVWCPNCEEEICSECLEYHKVSKASRQHKTTSIESLMNLPSFVRNLNQTCASHDDILELYCGMHQTPCCMQCVTTDHSECQGVTSLKKVVHGVKQSAFYNSVEKSVQDMKTFLGKLKQNREENLIRLAEQISSLKEEVKLKRQEINAYLDAMEKDLIQQVDFKINNEIEKVKKNVDKIHDQLTKLNKVQEHISKIIEYGSELQTYLGLKHIETEVTADEEIIASLSETDGMTESNASLDISKKIEELLLNTTSIGSVTISTNPLDLHFSVTKSQLAQTLPADIPIFEKINLKNLEKLNVPNGDDDDKEKINICSCIYLKDGRVVLANNFAREGTGELHMFNNEGYYDRKIPCVSSPFGMALINENELAVSFYKEKCISILDLKSLKFRKNIFKGYVHIGLSFHGSYLVSAARGTGIMFMNLQGTVLKILPVNVSNLNYIHFNGENIFYTNYTEHTLFVLNPNGEGIWKCTFEFMKGPRNVCTDRYGNLFVAACDSNRIVVVSSDGKKCRELLTSDDGICEPKAIYFNVEDSVLVVANRKGSAVSYKAMYQ